MEGLSSSGGRKEVGNFRQNSSVFPLFASVTEGLCRNLTLGPGRHSIFHQDRWQLVYCFADAGHADFFRETFGGETFDPRSRGRGMNWYRLRNRST
jgi:hypothetical protein